MGEPTFEREMLNKLIRMEKKVNYIVEYIEDTKLSVEDRKALEESLKEEKQGRLLSKKQVFG